MNISGTHLEQGFYTLKEASDLIALDVIGMNQSNFRSLFKPTKRYSEAVFSKRSYNGRVRDIGFLELIELRFIAHFRTKGVSAQALRIISKSAREVFGEHPFARRGIKYKTDKKKIYAESAALSGDIRLLELTEKQYELDLIEDSLIDGLSWDNNDLANLWKPRPDQFEDIIVSPRHSFGMPSLERTGIATSTLYKAWVAEEGSYEKVADWYEISEDLVKTAVLFQNELPSWSLN